MNGFREATEAVGIALLLGGFVGAAAIAALFRGGRLLAVWIAWLSVPFVGLAGLLLWDADPTLSQERASYNFWFGLVLISILMAVPWGLANLLGALVGRLLRRKPGQPGSGSALPPDRQGGR